MPVHTVLTLKIYRTSTFGSLSLAGFRGLSGSHWGLSAVHIYLGTQVLVQGVGSCRQQGWWYRSVLSLPKKLNMNVYHLSTTKATHHHTSAEVSKVKKYIYRYVFGTYNTSTWHNIVVTPFTPLHPMRDSDVTEKHWNPFEPTVCWS